MSGNGKSFISLVQWQDTPAQAKHCLIQLQTRLETVAPIRANGHCPHSAVIWERKELKAQAYIFQVPRCT